MKIRILRSGDSVSIGFANSKIKNVVSLVGAIENVGDYEWKKGLELNELIGSADDFLSNIDLQYGLIKRKNLDGTLSCISFKPQDLVFGNAQRILLQSQDLIYFFSRDQESRQELLSGLINDLA